MAIKGLADNDGIISEINITPLTDVMLVLLIIFMVTATFFVAEPAMQVELPPAVTSELVTKEDGEITVIVKQDGAMTVNDRPTTEAGLTNALLEAARDIQAGKYGKVLWVHCSKLQSRTTIGKVTEPQPVPGNIDYNLWAGPAPMTPVMRQQFHYDWHWQWNWGDGEMANWGIHYLDDVRHLLGWKDVPTKVVAAGNRFAWDDNGETPNMHFALMDYDGLPMVVDIRNLPDPARRGGKEGALYLGRRDGNYIQCENASIRISRGGGGAYDKDGKRIYQYKGDGGGAHGQNFINALRSGRREDLAAEIEVGHLGTTICHQANIAWRAGREATADQVRENMKSSEDALDTLKDMLEQLGGNNVDFAKQPFVLGPALTYDRKQERFVGPNAEQANKYLKCSYREPFIVPEQA